MRHRDLLTIAYGLHVIWTGLLRNIEAQAYKPNALWFCLVMGLVAIAAGYLLRLGKTRAGTATAAGSVAFVLGFYVYSFVSDPAADATVRVGAMILSSIAEVVVLSLPAARAAAPGAPPS